jgi:dTDP-4-dehydrorhamnose reductase
MEQGSHLQIRDIAATGLHGLVGHGIRLATTASLLWHDLATEITDAEAIDEAIAATNADTIVNYAAFSNVQAAWEQRGDIDGACYRVNVDGAQHVAASCRRHGKFLIHISTDYVYRGDRQEVYTEEDPTGPVEWYGQTKALSEEKVLGVDDRFAVFRIASPFQSSLHPKKEDLVTKIRRQLAEASLPPQFGDHIFHPTWVDDLGRAIINAERDKPSGIYNTVGSSALTPYETALEIATVYGLDPTAIAMGSLQDYLRTSERPYAQYLHLSNEKICRALGMKFADIRTALTIVREQQAVQTEWSQQ